MSVAQEIKSRLDIVQYIQQYVPLKKAGRYYKACCPFHSEKTPSFVVNSDWQTWRCFGSCAEGGDIFTFAMKQHGWSFSEALEELGRLAGVEVRQQTPAQKAHEERLESLRSLLQTAAEVYHHYLVDQDTDDAREVMRYAHEKRGFSEETIRHFGIGYAPSGWRNMLDYLLELGYEEDQVVEAGLAVRSDNKDRVYDRFRNRLMVPIRDERGRVTGFGARALAPDDNPKYLNSPQSVVFDKSRTLFALDSAKHAIRDSGTVVIVEGYMDAIQAHQAGFANVVAQMGTALTETQLKLVAPRYAGKIILALDADAAGQSATRRSLEVAREALQADYAGRLSVDIRILQIPGAKDPDDLLRETPDLWPGLVEKALPVADFVIDMETAALPEHATVQEREAVARNLLPILAASENNLYKKDNIQKLALRLRIAERDLMAWAEEQRRIAASRPPAPRPAPPEAPPSFDELPPEPPPYFDEDEDFQSLPDLPLAKPSPAPAQPAQNMERRGSWASEAYCLRILLQRPDLYYHVSRKLRELAEDNNRLLAGPLEDLNPDDFSQSEFRQLMDVFRVALNQDALEPVDFIRQNIDPSLQGELESLLADEHRQIHRQIAHRTPGDLDVIWKRFERRSLPMVNLGTELLGKVLFLRVQRLQRELEELHFMQMDVQAEGENAAGDELSGRVMLAMRAKHLLDVELKRQVTFI